MHITIKVNGVNQIIHGTAETAAYLVAEGHDVRLTDAAWKRTFQRMHQLGLNDTFIWENPEVGDTEIEFWSQEIIAESGGVEELWEELEILGMVAEWDSDSEDWA